MKVSVGTDNTTFKPVQVSNLSQLAKVATSGQWSSGVFKDNYRTRCNFLGADSIALDIDNEDPSNQTTLTDAIKLFKDFKHLIMTTKSHQTDKNGVVADRFRVVLFFSRTVTDAKEYYATWNLLRKRFPFIDQACSDPSRLWYASTQVVSVNEGGSTIDPAIPKAEEVAVPDKPKSLTTGELAKSTYKFLLEGALPGQRNAALYKAARDCYEQGIPKNEFVQRMDSMIKSTLNWGTDYVNKTDHKTIDSAYTGETRHPARKAFDLMTISDLMKSKETIEFIVDGMLTVGGISIISGDPKAGKSTLVRQLTLAIARGNEFLGRKCIKGACVYLALEEQLGLIKHELRKQGASNDEKNIYLHFGAPKRKDFLEELEGIITDLSVKFVVVDTFMLASMLKDANQYGDTNSFLQSYRELARSTGCHVMFIHHTNKGDGHGTNRISGSQAIHGGVDNAVMFTKNGMQRFISTSQRGGANFDRTKLEFDKETLTYSLGEEVGDDEF